MNPNHDPRDLLIQRQAQRIGQLEVELAWLRPQLAQTQANSPQPQETLPEAAE